MGGLRQRRGDFKESYFNCVYQGVRTGESRCLRSPEEGSGPLEGKLQAVVRTPMGSWNQIKPSVRAAGLLAAESSH